MNKVIKCRQVVATFPFRFFFCFFLFFREETEMRGRDDAEAVSDQKESASYLYLHFRSIKICFYVSKWSFKIPAVPSSSLLTHVFQRVITGLCNKTTQRNKKKSFSSFPRPSSRTLIRPFCKISTRITYTTHIPRPSVSDSQLWFPTRREEERGKNFPFQKSIKMYKRWINKRLRSKNMQTSRY